MRLQTAIFLLPLFAACSDNELPPLVASDVRIDSPAPGSTVAAAYLVLDNNSGVPVRITRVASPDYASVEIHQTSIENDIVRMRPVGALQLDDGERLRLQRGGMHLMLSGPVDSGDLVTLQFYEDDVLLLSVSATVGSTRD